MSIVLCFFFIGAWRASAEQEKLSHYEHILCSGPLAIEGIVTDVMATASESYQIILQLQRAWRSTSHTEYHEIQGVLVRIEGKGFTGKPGDLLLIPQIYLRMPMQNTSKRNLHKVGIVCNAKIGNFLSAQCTPGSSWHTTRYHLRNALLHKIQEQLSPQATSLISTLFLGYPMYSSDTTMRSLFERWGISHYLARSGLHIMIVLYLIQSFFICIPLSRTLRHLCIIGIGLFYTFISWPTVSFARALITTFWYIACMQSSLAIHSFHTIAMVTILVLCYQPLFLLCLDFQLSFSLTATLLCIRSFSQILSHTLATKH